MLLAVDVGKLLQQFHDLFIECLEVAQQVMTFVFTPLGVLVGESVDLGAFADLTPIGLLVGAGLLLFLVKAFVKFIV